MLTAVTKFGLTGKCINCGESHLEAETLHEIARIKLHRESFAVKRNVAAAEFV